MKNGAAPIGPEKRKDAEYLSGFLCGFAPWRKI
jgi:hypothetical protein